MTDSGGFNNLNIGALSVSLNSGTTSTYTISGLSGLQGSQGLYTVTVNAADLQDDNYAEGAGSLSPAWLYGASIPQPFNVPAGSTMALPYSLTVGSLTGGGTLDLNGFSLTVGNASDLSSTFTGVIADGSAAGSVVKAGTGTLTLSGADTYSGGTTISAGTLQVGSGSASGSLGSGTVTDNASLVFDPASTSPTTVGSITGTGSLTQEGSGTVILTSADSYTGGTTISGGTLETGTAASLGSGLVTLNGGTLSAGSSAPITGFGGNGTGWTINSSGITSTAITNNVLTLTDGNNSEGRSAFDNTPVATTGNFIASFTYTPSGSLAADGVAFVLQNEGPTALGGSGGALGYSGISNSIAIALNIYSGSGVGTNLFTSGSIGTFNSTSPVTLNDGDAQNITLIYNAAAQTLSETITDQVAGKTFATTYTGVNLSSIIGGGTAYVGFTGGTGGATSTQTISNFSFSEPTVAGFGGNGTVGGNSSGWTVNQSGTYSSLPTPINNNVLTLTDGNQSEARSAFDATPVPTTGNFVTSFTYTATSGQNPTNNWADGVAFVLQDSAAGDMALGGAGGGLGVSGIAGPGLVLSFNIYQPATVGIGYFAASSGSLSQNNGSYQPVSAVTLNNADPKNIVLSYNAAAETITETLTDLVTNATNATSPIVINNVNLATIFGLNPAYVGFTGALGGATATQTISNFNLTEQAYANPVNLTAAPGSSIIVPAGSSAVLSGSITGVGPLTTGGGGTLVLSGSNTYTGGTMISAGTLQPGSSTALGTGIVTVNGGTLSINSLTLQVAGLTLAGGSVTGTTGVLMSSSTYQVQSGSISAILGGSVGLDMTTDGTVTLSGVDTYSGGTTISQGTLQLESSFALGGGSVTVNGGTLNINTFNVNVPELTLASGSVTGKTGVLTATSTYVVESGSISAILGGSVGLYMTTGGTVTLSGANTYTGGTTISSGTLEIGSYDALGTGLVTLNDVNTGASNTALLATIPANATAGAPIPNNITVAAFGTGTSTLGTTAFSPSPPSPTVFTGNLTVDEGVTFQGGNSTGTTGTSWNGAISFAGNLNVQVTSAPNTSGAATTFGPNSTVNGSGLSIPLSSSFNTTGIYTDGATFSSSGGLDTGGNALSANLLDTASDWTSGSQDVWNGRSFTLGTAGSPDVVSAAAVSGKPQTIPLSQGNYTQLLLLADGVNGAQNGLTFTANYTDGTSSTFTQSFSDWAAPHSYAGESIAVSMPYRDGSNGGTGAGPFYVYGYSFSLNASKTLESITLPIDSNLEILAMDLVPPSEPQAVPQVNVSSGAVWNLSGSVTASDLTGTGTVDLNGSTLTIGDFNNLSSTFGGTIADGLNAGSVVKAALARRRFPATVPTPAARQSAPARCNWPVQTPWAAEPPSRLSRAAPPWTSTARPSPHP